MNIDWAVTCRYAESDGTLAYIMGAGTDVLGVQQIPGPVGTMVAIRLAATAEELEPGQQHILRCRILSPDGTPVRNPDGTEMPPLEVPIVAPGPIRQIVPGWLVNPMLTFALQWWAADEGSHSVEFDIDGSAHRQPVHVVPIERLQGPGTAGDAPEP